MRAKWGFFKTHPHLKYLWSNVNSRCGKKYDSRWKFYGGRGIKNLLTPNDLVFLWERDNAAKLSKPSLDRIDNNGNYSIENCRFIEFKENQMDGLRRAWVNNGHSEKQRANLAAIHERQRARRKPDANTPCRACGKIIVHKWFQRRVSCSNACNGILSRGRKRALKIAA